MDKIYSDLSYSISQMVTSRYSTSFSIGTRCLAPAIRPHVHAVYGFVRLADEIVDSFHGYDRESLLEELEFQYKLSLQRGISTNPILNAFQHTVTKYEIPSELVDSFLGSMKMDLAPEEFDPEKLRQYIYGSAEVVGMMCLKIFVQGNESRYQKLTPYAASLGSAFQKVNFLRDIRNDIIGLRRIYFPEFQTEGINETNKKRIVNEIYEDFAMAEKGIRQLPRSSRLGVYTAYLYCLSLTRAIENTPAELLMKRRVRVSDRKKLVLLGKAYLTNNFI